MGIVLVTKKEGHSVTVWKEEHFKLNYPGGLHLLKLFFNLQYYRFLIALIQESITGRRKALSSTSWGEGKTSKKSNQKFSIVPF